MPARHDGEMELRYLRYFVEAVRCGSITAAADRLRIAQPALSRQIRLLEHQIGHPLMKRTSRGVLLTEAGREFAKDAEKILSDLDAAVKRASARSRGDLGALSVGYAPSPTAELLPVALRSVEAAAPNVQITLHDLAGDEILAGLADERLHLSVMVDPGPLLPKNVVYHTLRKYRQCAAVAPKHPLARKRKVHLKDIVALPLVVYSRSHYTEYYSSLLDLLRPITDAPRIGAEVDGLTSLISAVLSGRGVAIVPEVFRRLAGDQLRLIPIVDAPSTVSVGYAYRTDLPLSPIARRLISALKAASK